MADNDAGAERAGRLGQFLKRSIKNDTKQALNLFFAPTKALAGEVRHSMKQLKTMNANKGAHDKKHLDRHEQTG